MLIYNSNENFVIFLLFHFRELQTAVPPTVYPAGGHVISHVVICSLYGVINSRKSVDALADSVDGVTDDQWNMLVAMAERLCSLGNHKDSVSQQVRMKYYVRHISFIYFKFIFNLMN